MTFTPAVALKGLTWNSISIGWTSPENSQTAQDTSSEKDTEIRNYLDYITYYKLTRKTDDHEVRTLRVLEYLYTLIFSSCYS